MIFYRLLRAAIRGLRLEWCYIAHRRDRDERWIDYGYAMPPLLVAWRCRRCGTGEGNPAPGIHGERRFLPCCECRCHRGAQ